MDVDVLTWEFPQAAVLAPKQTARWQVKRRIAVRVTSKFEAPPERVFDAWLDPRVAGKWLFATASRPIAHLRIDARVGGAFRFVERNDGGRIEHAGFYVEIVRPRRLVFTLSLEGDPKARTCVTTEIVARKGGSELTLIHENVPPEHANRIEGRWAGILHGLGVTLDQQPAGAGLSVPRRNGAPDGNEVRAPDWRVSISGAVARRPFLAEGRIDYE